MGCQADYTKEDLRLIRSVKEETINEVKKIIDKLDKDYNWKWQHNHTIGTDDLLEEISKLADEVKK